MGEHVRSVRGVPRTFTSSGNGKFHNSFTRNSQFPGCSSLLSRWSSRRSDARPRHRICTSRRARRPIRAIRSASRSTTSTSRGWCRGTSTSRPCTRTRWCWSRTARRGAVAGPIRPCHPSVPSSRREAATSCSRSSCRGCLTSAGGRSTHAGGQACAIVACWASGAPTTRAMRSSRATVSALRASRRHRAPRPSPSRWSPSSVATRANGLSPAGWQTHPR
jgi:hypothetical protein